MSGSEDWNTGHRCRALARGGFMHRGVARAHGDVVRTDESPVPHTLVANRGGTEWARGVDAHPHVRVTLAATAVVLGIIASSSRRGAVRHR